MAQLPMYAAMVNSPGTELAADITASATSINVLDAAKLPAAPNLVTLGGDETAETILYTGRTGNTLTGCTRGFEGTAKGWAAGSPAARNHTAYDYEAGRANIADVSTRVDNIVIPDGTTAQKGIVQLSNATNGTRSTVAATEKAVNDARVGIVSDYVRQPGYAVTTGTATAYVVTLSPAPSSLPDGFGITIVPHVVSEAAPTLNVNGIGAVALKKQDGSAFAAGDLKANTPYTFRKVGSDFLADSGSGEVVINGQLQQAVTYGETISANDPITLQNRLTGASIPALNAVGRSAQYSEDGIYLAAAPGTSPYLAIYKISGNVYTQLPNPSTLPTGTPYAVSWSPDGTYLVVCHNISPFITIYKRSGDTFTKLADPTILPTGLANHAAWSPDGIYLAVGHDTNPFMSIYKRSGDTFTKLANPTTLPSGGGRGLSFSPDGVYLAVGHASSPFLTVYKRSGDTFTNLANPAVLPTSIGFKVSWNSSGTQLALAYNATNGLLIYKRNSDTFTKLDTPSGLMASTPVSVSYSRDSKYLGVTHSSGTYMTVYLVNGDQFNKIADPNPSLLSQGTSLDFKPTSNNVVVTNATAPFIALYDLLSFAYKGSNLASDLVDAAGAGYALSSGVANDTKDAILIWR
ncbi:tail fiber protein [Paenibacillus sp. TC-CSREp1]|uniref:tail fiber protein n=1 Tax=Paenibacillus sp. TC-CSREp1 TaxID=3410089 RepID=UPI003CECF41C